MGVRVGGLVSLFLTTSTVLISGISGIAANAQERPTAEVRPVQYVSIPDAFQRVGTFNSGNFNENLSVFRQVDEIFGFGIPAVTAFRENEIAEDARLLAILYRDVLDQQVSTTPLIRTPDVVSPIEVRS